MKAEEIPAIYLVKQLAGVFFLYPELMFRLDCR